MSKIVYIGAERVGKACLQALIDHKKNITAIFTAAESLRSRIADYIPFDDIARKKHIPLFKITYSDKWMTQKICSFNPDLIIMVSWSGIISKEIIQCAPKGCVNIHYSLLPKGRGGAPLFWVIFNNLNKAGITLYYVDEGIDTGDIIGQVSFKILPTDTCKSLLDKILKLAPKLLIKYIDGIESGTVGRYKQDELKTTYTKARKPSESLIDWNMSKEEISRFIRALSPPYPPAFTILGKHRLFFTEAKLKKGKINFYGYLK